MRRGIGADPLDMGYALACFGLGPDIRRPLRFTLLAIPNLSLVIINPTD